MITRILLVCALVIPLIAADKAVIGGVGHSVQMDAKAAGAEAATAAKAALGVTAPRVVIVFAARKQLGPELVEGVASIFDKDLITGCEGYAPLTRLGNAADQPHNADHAVAVLALGGTATFTVAGEAVTAKGKDGFADCGRRLGTALAPALRNDGGQVILTFGNQHVGDNQPFVEALAAALGRPVPVVGAAAGGGGAKEILKGAVVTGTNIAILIQGAFTTGTGLAGGPGDLVAKAGRSVDAALMAGNGRIPDLTLVFDCGGRRGELVKARTIAAELEAITARTKESPLCGFYGGGEIGMADATTPKGVGFSVATAMIWNR